MQQKSANLEQIKNLLNKQINQTLHLQFSTQSLKQNVNNHKNATQIGNFTDSHNDLAMLTTPKNKFIQINEEPQLAEFQIKEFGSVKKFDVKQNSVMNSSIMNQYVKKPYYHHQKSKSSQTAPRHVSILMSHEDASCCSRGTTAAGLNFASAGKGSPLKKHGNGITAMSQISIFSHDISNNGDIMTSNNQTIKPETNQTHHRKNQSCLSKYQTINDQVDDKISPIQSPASHNHHRILSASVSQPSVSSAYLIKNESIIYKEFNQNNRPVSQNAQKSQPRDLAIKQRPMTAILKQQGDTIQQEKTLQQKGALLQKMINGLQKRKTINSASTACNSTVFELFDQKKIHLARQQKQKALDQFLKQKDQIRAKSSYINKNQQNEGLIESISQSEINSNGLINVASSQTLIETNKSNKLILQDIINDMASEQKDFVKYMINNEQRSIIFSQLFQRMEKIIEIKDLKLFTQYLIFISKCCLAVQDNSKAAFFLYQVKIITDMSKKVAPMKAQAYLLMGQAAINIQLYAEAVKIFKKALQYSWFFNQRESEIAAYEQLGVSYYYLQDAKLSEFYHNRYVKAQFELSNSYIRNMSYENINEQLAKSEYNLNQITPILMVHLNLPVQYSLDKVQQGLRESFLKQEQKNNKRNSQISQKLENLAKESQQQVENFVASRQKTFNQANAAKIIEQLIEDKEFIYETDTPIFFENLDNIKSDQKKQLNNNSQNSDDLQITPSDAIQSKKSWEAPIMRKVIYDISKFGPIKDPVPSQRVFEDITKYKLSLDKKIEILSKQKIDLNKIMEKVNYLVWNNQKYNAQMHQRVRISHLTPNRYDPLKYNTTYYVISQINKSYNMLLFQLKKAEQNIR
ncbi:hypothetical protein TTHERM_00473330 (macronuclear) [Tetrahymena thermophila SB210]|uniref:Tetratricopeptide repeat protein n=1 Tax=Tetrahymena thermophila (strain SB210) TaxID=312017 RepID=I7MA41_TETTS|nr:hypothetical protein TTHERM_00473330 [Tetrahymena thermophila SB210]EAS03671.2 hypothetical protein TTHERM_00473330 [Tetrahymena thermophila SB210]|eukprot:XP_001023916.2 hypothetical protein TTHERM_00473330 [Tetrahymena thermophila SB210]